MRVRAQVFNGTPSGFTPIAWTLPTTLGSFLLSSGQGVVRLTDLAALRQMRSDIQTFVAEFPGNPGGFYIEQASPLVRATISFRDTIALEDEQGHLASP